MLFLESVACERFVTAIGAPKPPMFGLSLVRFRATNDFWRNSVSLHINFSSHY